MAQVDPILQQLMGSPEEEQMLIAQLLNPAAQQQRMSGVSDLFDLSGLTNQPAAAKPKPAAPKPMIGPKKKVTPAVVVPAPGTQGQLTDPTPPMTQDLTVPQGISAESLPSLSESDKMYLDMQTPGMRDQRGTIDQIRQMIGAYDPNIPDYNLASILGASDILTGSQFMEKYKTPKQQKQAADMNKINMLMGLAKGQGELSKDEIDLYKATSMTDLKRLLGLSDQEYKVMKTRLEELGRGTRLGTEEEGKMTRLQFEEEQKMKRLLEEEKGKNKRDGTGGGARRISPGWVHDGVTEINKGDVPKLQNAISDGTTTTSRIQAAMSLLESATTEELLNPFSDKSKKIAQELADAQLTYKGEAFANLGVLTGPDTSYLDKILMRPGSIGGLTSSKATLKDNYLTAIKFLNSKVENKLGARGVVREGGGTKKSSPKAAMSFDEWKKAKGK